MGAKYSLVKKIWKALPPSWIVGVFTHLPEGVIKYIGPIDVTIEPTNICNFSCPLCPRTKLTRKYGSMSIEHFKHIIDTLPWSVRLVELYLLGEPLMAKDIFLMIKYARSKGLLVRISTNASYLEKFTNQILESGLSQMIVSVDGATEETYKQYRIGGDFPKVIQGIKHFMEEKKKMGVQDPQVIFQFIVMKHNEHEIEAVKELAKKLGVDHLQLKRVSMMDNRRDIKVQESLKKRFLPTNQRFVRDSFKNTKLDPCRWAFSAQVLQDGRVTSCCYDGDGKHVKGNAFEQDFKKIFRSEEYSKMRKAIIAQKLDICKGCDYNTQVTERVF